MSDDEGPKFPLNELLKAGPKAPLVLVRYVIERRGPEISGENARARQETDFHVESHVDDLVKKQLLLFRGQGALAGLSFVLAGAAGPGAVPVAATAILSGCCNIRVLPGRFVPEIAAAYGHDLTDHETGAHEILHLHGIEIIGGEALAAPIGAASERVVRLGTRHAQPVVGRPCLHPR